MKESSLLNMLFGNVSGENFMVKRCKMKRTIVNFAQFVRYLADRASIKLTQFAMKNVSVGRRFEGGIIFMFADRGEEENRSSPFRLPLWLSVRLFVFLLAVTGLEKREFKNLTARNIQSARKGLNQRMSAKIRQTTLCCGDLSNLLVSINVTLLISLFLMKKHHY